MFVQTGQQRAVLNASMCWCSCNWRGVQCQKTAAGASCIIHCNCIISHKDRHYCGAAHPPLIGAVWALHTHTMVANLVQDLCKGWYLLHVLSDIVLPVHEIARSDHTVSQHMCEDRAVLMGRSVYGISNYKQFAKTDQTASSVKHCYHQNTTGPTQIGSEKLVHGSAKPMNDYEGSWLLCAPYSTLESINMC